MGRGLSGGEADMKIVGSTGSTLPEPSLENTLRSHARFIFAFEEPEKLGGCLWNQRVQFPTLLGRVLVNV